VSRALRGVQKAKNSVKPIQGACKRFASAFITDFGTRHSVKHAWGWKFRPCRKETPPPVSLEASSKSLRVTLFPPETFLKSLRLTLIPPETSLKSLCRTLISAETTQAAEFHVCI
jgi:hypothetical protein